MLKIRHKIWLSFLGIIIISIVLVGIISILHANKLTSKEANKRLLELTEKHANKLEKGLYHLEQSAQMLEGLLKATFNTDKILNNEQELIRYKKKYSPLVDSICRSMQPLSLWIVFHPQITPGGHSISFVENKSNPGYYQRSTQYRVTDMDLTNSNMKWWTGAMEYGDIWTEPYYWWDWDRQIISYSKAVDIKNTTIAAVGSDFDFHNFSNEIFNITVYETGYIFLLNGEKRFIVHPERKGDFMQSELSEEDYGKFCQLIETSDKGIFKYSYREKDKILGYKKLHNGWFIAATAPASEIYKNVIDIRRSIIYVIIGAIIISWILAYFMGMSLTKPISQLVEYFRKGLKGQLDQRAKIVRKDEIGELTKHFNMFMDKIDYLVSNLKKSEEDLVEAKVKAEEADRLKSSFLRNVSHEIRTPLNAIVGFANLLEGHSLSDTEEKECIKSIESNTERLTNLIDNLIDFSKFEMERVKPNFVSFNLNKLLKKIYLSYADQTKTVDFRLQKDWSDEDAYILTDRFRLKKILDILLSNAFKFTKQGEIVFGYTIDEESRLILFVKDTGIGIDDEEAKIIFRAFRQVDESTEREFEGIGMGLAMVKQIVELLNGRIWFESKPGEGTIFYFTVNYQNSIASRL